MCAVQCRGLSYCVQIVRLRPLLAARVKSHVYVLETWFAGGLHTTVYHTDMCADACRMSKPVNVVLFYSAYTCVSHESQAMQYTVLLIKNITLMQPQQQQHIHSLGSTGLQPNPATVHSAPATANTQHSTTNHTTKTQQHTEIESGWSRV